MKMLEKINEVKEWIKSNPNHNLIEIAKAKLKFMVNCYEIKDKIKVVGEVFYFYYEEIIQSTLSKNINDYFNRIMFPESFENRYNS